MLIGFGVKNFYCFNEWTELSMESGNKKSSSELNGVMVVKGANASGKTQLLKGLCFIQYIARNSIYDEKVKKRKVPFNPFFGNDEPSEFYVRFKINNFEYEYSFGATQEEILYEKLIEKEKVKGARSRTVINRTKQNVDGKYGYEKIKTLPKPPSHASILSIGFQYELECLDQILEFFGPMDSNMYDGGPVHFRHKNVLDCTELYYKNPKLLKLIKNFLKSCDTGISDILIDVYKDDNNQNEYQPTFIHEYNGKKFKVSWVHESSGSLYLYWIMSLISSALKYNSLLIIDEFDAYLHPLIAQKIIKTFLDIKQEEDYYPQLIIASQNTEILDIVNKYCVYITQKKENESFGYRLDEIKFLRNDRIDLASKYKENKLGGVPNVTT